MLDVCIICDLVLHIGTIPCRRFSLVFSLRELGLYVSKTKMTSLNPAVRFVSLSLKLLARSFTVLSLSQSECPFLRVEIDCYVHNNYR